MPCDCRICRRERRGADALDGLFLSVALAAALGAIWWLQSGCRRPAPPPIPPSDGGSDAAPLPEPADAAPAPDGTVSECTLLPELDCADVAAEHPGDWLERSSGALDEVMPEIARPLAALRTELCGQTGTSREVFYTGDDSDAHRQFANALEPLGWEIGEVVWLDGCRTAQAFQRGPLTLNLATRREQRVIELLLSQEAPAPDPEDTL